MSQAVSDYLKAFRVRPTRAIFGPSVPQEFIEAAKAEGLDVGPIPDLKDSETAWQISPQVALVGKTVTLDTSDLDHAMGIEYDVTVSEACDECDGSGYYLIDNEKRECLCLPYVNVKRLAAECNRLAHELHRAKRSVDRLGKLAAFESRRAERLQARVDEAKKRGPWCQECGELLGGWNYFATQDGVCAECHRDMEEPVTPETPTRISYPTQTPGKSILDLAKEAVDDRARQYGNPLENHQITADFWTTHARGRGLLMPGQFFLPEDVCWMNVLQKNSRDCFMPKVDNLVDGAGYLRNVEVIRALRAREGL